MSTQAVKLSGIVYVRDPKTSEEIKRLRVQISQLNKENKQLKRLSKPTRETDALKIKLNRARNLLKQRHAALNRFRNMRVDNFIRDRVGFRWWESGILRVLDTREKSND